MKLHWRSPALRAVVIVLIVAVAPLLVVGVAQLWDFSESSRLLRHLEEAADGTARELGASGLADYAPIVAARAREHRMRVRVLNSRGSVLLDEDRQEAGILRRLQQPLGLATSVADFDRELGAIVVRPEFAEAAEGGSAADCRTTGRGEHLVCHALRDLGHGNTLYLQDNAPVSVRELEATGSLLARLTLLVLPIALLLAIWLAWRILAPIEQLRSQLVAQAAEAVPGARLKSDRGDELGDLAAAFNALLDRLSEREQAHEAFVADLAHELKSPVGAVGAAAERLEAGAVTPERAERLARILADSSRRMEALLDHLLAIAHAEAGLGDEDRELVDVGALLGGICASHRLTDPTTPIELDCSQGLCVLGVPSGLEAALRNLIENAAAFGAGSPVRVEAMGQHGRMRIDVRDQGPGIEPADLPRVFDRFFTTRSGARGTGLGLALVKAIIEAHGGTVSASSEPGDGALFSVLLPSRPPG